LELLARWYGEWTAGDMVWHTGNKRNERRRWAL